jgi:ribosomal peptide maturation radical SAM protein 1
MTKATDVALISMPFGGIASPSIGLSLLKAGLDRIDVSTKIFYFNLSFAELIGQNIYKAIWNETDTPDLVGEWIFSTSLFGPTQTQKIAQYTDEILRRNHGDLKRDDYSLPLISEALIQDILRTLNHVEPFLKQCLEEVIRYQPKVVGFTSVFQQQVSSLSLAKLIKKHLPGTLTVLGGANCEGIMGQEIIRQFEFIDVVVSGEADIVFPEIVERALKGQPIYDVEGVFLQRNQNPLLRGKASSNSPDFVDLNALPIPDYDDYFEQLGQSPLVNLIDPSLLFETSRGCWWGAKHHCTFCGLNGTAMTFRSKSAKRALDELLYLSQQYPGYPFMVVDNILDMKYFKDFIPFLAEQKLGLRLAYEVKSNLTKEQLILLQEAGITRIQPGIESLSDQVLQIMRKGVRALQNIQLLKWCEELNINLVWNFIWGFPGESAVEYQRMADFVPLLTHLPPPIGSGKVRIDRFSPYYNQAEEFGLKNLRPFPAYQYVYPLSPEAVDNLASCFTYEYAYHQPVDQYAQPLSEKVIEWRNTYQQSELFWIEKGRQLLIWDTRPVAEATITILTGLEKFAYIACDQVKTPGQILSLWNSRSKKRVELTRIKGILDALSAKGLMINQDDSYLALAIPRSHRILDLN